MNLEQIARIAHEVNRAYCEAISDPAQPAWDDAPEWLKAGAMRGVQFHLDNPTATPEQSHAKWMEDRIDAGWVFSPTKNVGMKWHPNLRPWNELPFEQRAKDHIFRAVVAALLSVPRPTMAVGPVPEGMPGAGEILKPVQPLPPQPEAAPQAGTDIQAAASQEAPASGPAEAAPST